MPEANSRKKRKHPEKKVYVLFVYLFFLAANVGVYKLRMGCCRWLYTGLYGFHTGCYRNAGVAQALIVCTQMLIGWVSNYFRLCIGCCTLSYERRKKYRKIYENIAKHKKNQQNTRNLQVVCRIFYDKINHYSKGVFLLRYGPNPFGIMVYFFGNRFLPFFSVAHIRCTSVTV